MSEPRIGKDMTPERWKKVESIFQAAVERDPKDRAAFLDEACAEDDSLRREVESLIASHDQAGSLFETASGNAETADTTPLIDQMIGPYRILSKLGAGGMGEVYLARDTRLDRRIALKLLAEGLETDEEQKRRFVQEAKAASALNHPHILAIYDIGSVAGRDFIAMEYVEGQTLRECIGGGEPLPLKTTLEVGAQLASALARAHQNGIIHRDLKPENIMIGPDGYAKILDFGLAKLTESISGARDPEAETLFQSQTKPGMLMGTPRYMSPEQAQGSRVDHRSDIFSLGCVLYEMAAGQPPFSGDSLIDTLHAIMHDRPKPLGKISPDSPPDLERVIDKCLEKSPADRYQQASEIEADLRRLRAGLESRSQIQSFLQKFFTARALIALATYLIGIWAATRAMDWLVNRYVLSPHLNDFIFVALLSLLPAVFLLSYAGGKAKPKWRKLKVIGIPVNVVIAVALLLFLFRGKDLGAATRSVTLVDEQGQKIERVIPKSEFRKKVAIFFFKNESNESEADWLQYGLSFLLQYDLIQDHFIDVRGGYDSADLAATNYSVYEKMKAGGFPTAVGLPLTLEKKIADDLHMNYFVSGAFTKKGEELTVKMRLFETRTGKAVSENTFTGEDPFRLADEMSVRLRYDMKIPGGHIEDVKDLPVSEMLTRSTGAFRSFIEGVNLIVFDRDWRRGQESLERAAKEDSTFAVAHSELQSLYLLTNQGQKREGAYQLLMQNLHKLPERLQYLVKAGYFEFREDTTQQLAAVKMLADLYPEDTLGHLMLGSLYVLRRQFDEALSEYHTALELDPERYDILHHIAGLHVRKGEAEEALKYCKQYADRFPEKAQSFTEIAALYGILGEHDQAKSNYEKARIIEPDNIFILASLAGIEASLGNYDQALKQYNDALKASKTPQDKSGVYGSLISFYEERGQLVKSLEYRRSGLAEEEKYLPHVFLLIERLNGVGALVTAGRKDMALQTLRSVETQLGPPWDKLIHIGYLSYYLELEDPDNTAKALIGVESFMNARRMYLLRPGVVHAQGRIHEMRGEYEQALASYQEQLKLTPMRVSVYRYIGRCLGKLKRFDEAEQHLKKALKVYPVFPLYHYELALLYRDWGNREKAIEHLNSALNVWRDADPQYKPAMKARELLAELRSSGG
ncbi:MAG: protein kinase [Acidobacteriota bacterium]